MLCGGRSHRRLLELHKQYGSIVRIGPNELSYTVPEAWEAIMGRRKGASENPKAPWYCPPDGKHIAGAPHEDHVRMRRIMLPAFSASAMLQQQPIIKGYVDLFINRLRDQADHGEATIDIGQWFNYCAFDIVGDLAFGETFGCLQDSALHPWISMIFANLRAGAIGVGLKRFPLLRVILPLLVPKKLRQLGESMHKFSRDKVAKRLAAGSSRPDFIETMTLGKKDLVSIFEDYAPHCLQRRSI